MNTTANASTATAGAPLVSVITIFLDAAPYIEDAIRSVLAQTWTAWELLLVDDGSSDGSTDIARRFATAYPHRIRYLEHPAHANRGMSATRNLGLRRARGELVAFLDADDVWLPRRLAHHVALLGRDPDVDMVYGPTLLWHGWTGRADDAARDCITDLHIETDRTVRRPGLLRAFLETSRGALPGMCSITARREAVERVGGFESGFAGAYEDQVFFAKMSLHASAYITGECLDRYRQHPASYCHRALAAGEYHPHRPHATHERFLNWLEDYVHKEGVTDRAILRALRRELRPYREPLRFRVGLLLYRVRRALQSIRSSRRPRTSDRIVAAARRPRAVHESRSSSW